ncbi:MAG: Hsp70 family protein [Acidimicrobiales bacterium]
MPSVGVRYSLGVDLGTTFSAAAVFRESRAEICSLRTHHAALASVVFRREDGAFLVGEAAARRAVVEPDRVAREFKRRVGPEPAAVAYADPPPSFVAPAPPAPPPRRRRRGPRPRMRRRLRVGLPPRGVAHGSRRWRWSPWLP